MKLKPLIAIWLILVFSCERAQESSSSTSSTWFEPWNAYPELFEDVQMSGVFEDSKTFVDCVPKMDPVEISKSYLAEFQNEGFVLEDFVTQNFELPSAPANDEFTSSKNFESHLNNHWNYLTRSSNETNSISTLVDLPYPYIVPGGRFREIYYWDSYFSMIGLGVSKRNDLIESMLDNFAYLIDTIGYIPNGNRTYFFGRSQPPFFAAMVNLYVQLEGPDAASKYLPAVEKEYNFWMNGKDRLNESTKAVERVVNYNGAVLNRYYDNKGGPREESYREDIELAEGHSNPESLYLNLRAACESGWDFSSRWFDDSDEFASIRTTEILPVDLNALLYNTEQVLSQMYSNANKPDLSHKYLKLAEARYQAMNELFWNDSLNIFQDLLWESGKFTGKITAASYYPMYFKVSNATNAAKQAKSLTGLLLADGGIVTTLNQSGQQWDSPNGWAPHQWVAFKGLQHYGENDLADRIRKSWLSVNSKVFLNTGKMMEKYNVNDTTLLAGGGEYPNQDGFGWTNGVALGMLVEGATY